MADEKRCPYCERLTANKVCGPCTFLGASLIDESQRTGGESLCNILRSQNNTKALMDFINTSRTGWGKKREILLLAADIARDTETKSRLLSDETVLSISERDDLLIKAHRNLSQI